MLVYRFLRVHVLELAALQNYETRIQAIILVTAIRGEIEARKSLSQNFEEGGEMRKDTYLMTTYRKSSLSIRSVSSFFESCIINLLSFAATRSFSKLSAIASSSFSRRAISSSSFSFRSAEP